MVVLEADEMKGNKTIYMLKKRTFSFDKSNLILDFGRKKDSLVVKPVKLT